MPKVILLTGFAMFFCGLAIFGTETALQFVTSALLIIVGLTAMNWIAARYDFSRNNS